MGRVTTTPPTATDLAAGVRAGRPSAGEAARQALERIARFDPDLHAFSSVDEPGALRAAERVDGLDAAALADSPLAGVPLAVKDEFAVDDPAVRRLVAAGAVPVGRTATPELCVWPATDSARGGVTRSPWDRSLSPGGSSGGSAAAVAAGMVPLALGSDGMGSLRIPAAACGLVTLKPGRGLLPDERGAAATWGGLSEPGPLATSVADVALALSVLSDGATPATVAPAADGVRVGVSTASPLRLGTELVRVRTDWAQAARGAADTLASLGARTVDADPPRPDDALLLLARWTSGVARRAEAENLPLSAMERRNRHHALLGRTVFARGGAEDGDTRWNRAVTRLEDEVLRAMDKRGLDVWLTPAMADLPLPATRWHERSWGRTLWASLRSSPFCAQWNVLGWPAMAVPFGETTAPSGRRVPTAVQLVGRPGSEALLLGVAAALESAAPWQRTAD